MSVLDNFKNIPRSPYGGRQGSNVIFFLQICNEVPGEKKEGGLSPPQRATSPVAHPRGDRVPCINTANWNNCFRSFFSKILFRNSIVQANPLKHWPPFAAILEPKNSEKKRGVRRRKAAKLCRIAYS